MIVVTFKGAPNPLIGKIRGWGTSAAASSSSVAAAIKDAMNHFANDREGFMFVSSGARINTTRVYPKLQNASWDVAAHVDRIGNLPQSPRGFDGVGRVSLDCVVIRRTQTGLRVLNRWIERNSLAPGRESINLAISLAEIRDTSFLFLDRTWIWRESSMRALDPMAEPVIEFESKNGHAKVEPVKEEKKPDPPKASPAPPAPVYKPRGPEVLWNGHFYSYASYGKINREILFRVSNSINVKIHEAPEAMLVDEYTKSRVDAYKSTIVGPSAPFFRFFGPDFRPPDGRHRICWTMMETAKIVHPDMAKLVNENYDELWVPTAWNAGTFKAGGVNVPISVFPLGVNPVIYRPLRRKKLPVCRLVSTARRGATGIPSGFIFLSVGLISPRKGFDVVAEALELAFKKSADIDLVLAITHATQGWDLWVREKFSKRRVRVWLLEGKYTEHEMADIYASSDAYVSASIGEGWNLCAQEAAACGLPVIVPRNSAHPDVFGDDDFTLFPTDGDGPCPDVEPISPWYVDMEFSIFGKTARRELAERLLAVYKNGRAVRERTKALQERSIRINWDIAADNVARRLIQVQGKK